MSRYLKADPGVVFKGKKVFSSAGATSFTIPSTSLNAKVMVFGGGGNSCGVEYCSCVCSCSCISYQFLHSGAGGGFAEKTYTGVSGCTACVIVGAAEGTSSFCIASLGTVSATGGTSTTVGSVRCTIPGCGSGGDINRCGSRGGCNNTYFSCNCCYGGCTFTLSNVAIPGGSPGSTQENGISPSGITCNYVTCLINRRSQGNCTGYGINYCNCYNCTYCVYCDLPKGFGACPLETDRYYAYDWDITGGSKCLTSGNPVATTVTVTPLGSYYACNCCLNCCEYCVNTIGYPSSYPVGVTGGIAGSGAAGGIGGIGGGGAGILNTCATPRTLPNFYSGGTGLVVVYY